MSFLFQEKLFTAFLKEILQSNVYRLSVSADKTKNHIGFLSVSADKKFEFIGDYRYRPIRKKAYRSATINSYSIVYAL